MKWETTGCCPRLIFPHGCSRCKTNGLLRSTSEEITVLVKKKLHRWSNWCERRWCRRRRCCYCFPKLITPMEENVAPLEEMKLETETKGRRRWWRRAGWSLCVFVYLCSFLLLVPVLISCSFSLVFHFFCFFIYIYVVYRYRTKSHFLSVFHRCSSSNSTAHL